MEIAGFELDGPKYHCAKHGPQGHVVGVQVSIVMHKDAPNQAYADGFGGRFCMQCFVEMLAAHCCELTEVPQ